MWAAARVLMGGAAAMVIAAAGAHAQGSSPASGGRQATGGTVAVVELFTSQGCSSCPAADRLFESYAKRGDIVALSYAVDYWDYLGWKDTLADPRFSKRQRAYSAARGDGQVYTPQIVVNGREHVLGSDAGAIERALARQTAAPPAANAPAIDIKTDDTTITISLSRPNGGSGETATLWLVVLTPRVEVQVTRGENRGRTLTYYNVVRELMPVGKWMGEPSVFNLDRKALLGSSSDLAAVLLQQGKGGPIVSARWVEARK